MESVGRSRCVSRSAAVLLLVVVVHPGAVQSQGADARLSTSNIYQLDRWVEDRLCAEASGLCEPENNPHGHRLSLFPRGLRKGVRVRPHGSEAAAAELECASFCSLFFLDLKPGAHFAHPIVIGLYDHETGGLQAAAGAWWPVLNDDHPVLHTRRSRARSSVRERVGGSDISRTRPPPPEVWTAPPISPDLSFPEPTPVGLNDGRSCNTGGLVVNGYRDPDDTFDDDAQGMYVALRGFGVPDDKIIFVSPYESSRRDHTTSLSGLREAFGAAASLSAASEFDDFVVLLSTHGGKFEFTDPVTGEPKSEYRLKLMNRRRSYDEITGEELVRRIKTIKTKKLTLIVEACQSGSIDPLIATEFAGADIEPRLFLSAGHNKPSWADIDDNDSNREDLGSETIWGYIEALGSSAADGAVDGAERDGRISFCEALFYAKDYDATRVPAAADVRECTDEALNDDWNAVIRMGAADNLPVHACADLATSAEVSFTDDGLDTHRWKRVDDYGRTQVVKRCTNAPLSVTVKNEGATRMPVGTLRLFGRVLDDDGNPVTGREPYANLVLVGDLKPGESRTLDLRWGVRPLFRKKERVALFATFDSPQAPVWGVVGTDGTTEFTPWETNEQACQCDVSVVRRCFPIVGCRCRKYVPPEIVEFAPR